MNLSYIAIKAQLQIIAIISTILTIPMSIMAQTPVPDNTMNPSGSNGGYIGQVLPYYGSRNLVPNGDLNDQTPIGSNGNDPYSEWNFYNWVKSQTGHIPTGVVKIHKDSTRYWPYDLRHYKELSDYPLLFGLGSQGISHLGNIVFKPLEFVSSSSKRNYMLFELQKPTEIGHKYVFHIICSSTGGANFEMNRIEAVLTDSLPSVITPYDLLDDYEPFFSSPHDTIIDFGIRTFTDTIIGTGEKFLIIGNFDPVDSLSFNGPISPGNAAEWVIDDIYLYDPDCPYGNVYVTLDTLMSCPGASFNLSVQPSSSFSANYYTWTDNGDTLSSTNSTQNGYVVDSLNHQIVISIDTGYCFMSDTMTIISSQPYLHIRDTSMFCDSAVTITPEILDSMGGTFNITNLSVECLSSTYSYSAGIWGPHTFHAPDTGFYEVSINYNISSGCSGVLIDTFHIAKGEDILFVDSTGTTVLSKFIHPETCINMMDGAITFNDSIYPDTIYYNWLNVTPIDTNSITGLGASTVDYIVWDNKYRCSIISDSIPLTLTSCGEITGNINWDTNRDCIIDSFDIPVMGATIIAQPIGNIAVSDSSGDFTLYVPPGTYTLERNYSSTLDSLHCSNVNNISIPSTGFTFAGVQHLDTAYLHRYDFSIVDMNMPIPLMGFPNTYALKVTNSSAHALNSNVDFYCNNSDLIFNYAASPDFIGMNGDTAQFSIGSLNTGQSHVVLIDFTTSINPAIIGDSVRFFATVSIDSLDIDLSNNSFLRDEIILSSYDPNYKISRPLVDQNTFWTRISQREFDYKINFQNTGNAPAINVRLIDSIPSLLDLSTIQLIGSSHPVQISSFNNVVYFDFDNINLPDSSQGHMASQGNVIFRISSESSAGENDTIANFSDIYFDNNPPIRTDTAINIYHRYQAIDTVYLTSCLGQSIYVPELGISFNSDTLVEYVYYSDIDEDSISNYILEFIPPAYTYDTLLICQNDSVLVDSNYYYAGDEFTELFVSSNGCDSIFKLYVEEDIVNTMVDLTSDTLSAQFSPSNSYQWVDCENGYSAIPGATSAFFSPSDNGSFAVIIYNGNCTDTSSCYEITGIGISGLESTFDVGLWPNPASDIVILKLSQHHENLNVIIYNTSGKLMRQVSFNNPSTTIEINTTKLSTGIYNIVLRSEKGEHSRKLIIR